MKNVLANQFQTAKVMLIYKNKLSIKWEKIFFKKYKLLRGQVQNPSAYRRLHGLNIYGI